MSVYYGLYKQISSACTFMHMVYQSNSFVRSYYYYLSLILYRLCFSKGIPPTVMFGAMVWCCLRSGQLGRSHSHNTQTTKSLDWSSIIVAALFDLVILKVYDTIPTLIRYPYLEKKEPFNITFHLYLRCHQTEELCR